MGCCVSRASNESSSHPHSRASSPYTPVSPRDHSEIQVESLQYPSAAQPLSLSVAAAQFSLESQRSLTEAHNSLTAPTWFTVEEHILKLHGTSHLLDTFLPTNRTSITYKRRADGSMMYRYNSKAHGDIIVVICLECAQSGKRCSQHPEATDGRRLNIPTELAIPGARNTDPYCVIQKAPRFTLKILVGIVQRDGTSAERDFLDKYAANFRARTGDVCDSDIAVTSDLTLIVINGTEDRTSATTVVPHSLNEADWKELVTKYTESAAWAANSEWKLLEDSATVSKSEDSAAVSTTTE